MRLSKAVRTTRPPTCSGTGVDRASSRPVVDAVPGMRCTLIVTISNDSPLSLHLDQAIADLLGPGRATLLHVPTVKVRVLGLSHRRSAPEAFTLRLTGRTPAWRLGAAR